MACNMQKRVEKLQRNKIVARKNLSKRHHQSSSQRCRITEEKNVEDGAQKLWVCVWGYALSCRLHMKAFIHVCNHALSLHTEKSALNLLFPFFSGWMNEKWMKMERGQFTANICFHTSSHIKIYSTGKLHSTGEDFLLSRYPVFSAAAAIPETRSRSHHIPKVIYLSQIS